MSYNCELLTRIFQLEVSKLKDHIQGAFQYHRKSNRRLTIGCLTVTVINDNYFFSVLYRCHSFFDITTPKIANTHIHHTIQTGDHNPINSNPYRVHPEKQQIMADESNSMHEHGLLLLYW